MTAVSRVAPLKRPALQTLLVDIERGKVDTVVVYKVDRLTRSLADFAKIVEVFDARGVSFVSVTQQFNTTTSMGRLTLNMLLSFAQFEREVTAERIRDKIAASEMKGMWMGGLPPLGYDIHNKKLVINPHEAETVRTLFRLYLELGTVKRLGGASLHLGLVTKRRKRPCGQETGGLPFTRGHLYHLLSNPIYAGKVAHGGISYPGLHDAIIGREIFDAVSQKLAVNAASRTTATNANVPSLLTGLVTDETGDRLCPTHANKKGCRYRYYISKRLKHRTNPSVGGWRLRANELDNAVVRAVGDFLTNDLRIIEALKLTGAQPERLADILARAARAAIDLNDRSLEQSRRVLHRLLHRVTLHSETMRIEIKRTDLDSVVSGNGASTASSPDELIDIHVPISLKRRGVEAKLIVRAPANKAAAPDQNLIALVAQGNCWFEQLAGSKIGSIREIAERDGIDASEVGRSIRFAFLAPDITEAILTGGQPVELTAWRLRRIGALPLDWRHQRRLLGFAT